MRKKTIIIKEWDELTDDEKQKEIKNFMPIIKRDWDEQIKDEFYDELEKNPPQTNYFFYDFVTIDGGKLQAIRDLQIELTIDKFYVDDIEISFNRFINNITYIKINGEWLEWEKAQKNQKNKIIVSMVKKDFEKLKNKINTTLINYYNKYNNIPHEFINFIMVENEFEFEIKGDF